MLSSVAFQHHLSAGLPYERALAAAGHPMVAHGADALLIDLDLPPYRPTIDMHRSTGSKVFLYPHGVGVMYYYDGIEEPYEHTDGMFVIAPGFAEVYRRIGYPHPVHVIGWPHCELLPFRAHREPRRVLFAPMHPLEDGYLSDWQQDLNREVFRALRAVPGIELKVRHLHELEQNGLTREPDVEYVQGQPDNSYADIDQADVVVACETYAFLAIARGAPTIMFGQHVRPSNGEHRGERTYVKSWEAWRGYTRYPFDMRDAAATDLIAAVAASEEPIREWRDRFIGEPLDPARFSAMLEEALAGARLPEMRSRVIVAYADELTECPELIAAYAAVVGADDDATLILLAPDADPDELVARLYAAFEAAGLAEGDLPDLLLLTDPLTEPAVRAIAGRACALLSGHPGDGPFAALPCHDARTAGELRPRAAA